MTESQADQASLPSPGELRQVVVQAALAAGDIIRAGFGKVPNLRLKGEVDLVTEVDEQAEREIVRLLRASYPRHRVLAEEGAVGGDDPRHRWLVDPLDGTTNYAHGFPFFSTSIAYELDGEVVLGAVYDPLRDELFLAQRGRGATLNGRRIAVTETSVLLHSLLATGFPYDRSQLPRALRQFALFSARGRAVRRLGSAALDAAYVAAGRLDGYWEAIVHPWDVAAGWLLVAEAGGRVSDPEGGPFAFERGAIVASNGRIHQDLLAGLAEAELAS